MANKIKIKRSAVQGKVPVTTDLELGELAINTYDGKLYTKKNDGSESVVQIGGASGATDLGVTTTTTSNTITSSTGTNATIGEATSSAAGLMSAAHHDKLDGIAAGAEVNVQSDWNATSGDAQILNKPTIPTNNNQLTNGAGYITATLTNEQVQDIVGGMVTGNTESGIAVTYQDADGTLDFSVASQTDNNFTDADHAKLDGIEANATADQTGAEIKAAYEGEADTNAFTDAEKTKLSGIAAGAEVNTVDSVNSQTGAVVLDADDIDDTSTTNKFATAAQLTKLAGIEAGATADQTAGEIKTAYESNTNTNAFTDAEKTKLSGIAAGAEVNVDTNLSYTASTRVLASSTGTNATLPEVVAAGNSGLMTGADKTKLNGIEAGATADQTAAEIKTAYESNTNTNAFTDAEKTKLSGIEASADVTDASNVAAAGAVMESDTTTASMSFVIDEDTMVSNSSTKVPTQQSVKAYVDAEVAGVVDAAPGALDTLNELAAALGDDPNFATTVTNSLATKLPLAGGTMTGNIVMSGSQTVDGRDLSVDGAKLDGIEAGATADQTASEIRALVESATDSNVFTDADHTKLNGIAAGAQVNVATNLGVTTTTTSNTITSSTGSNATIGEATGSAAGLMSTAHHNKLDGIASGAEVNVQSDWNATSGDALILNKPTIPTNNNQLTNGAGYITSADGGNAATLDGLDSTQFLRSDTSDTFSGNLTIDNGTGTNLIVKCDNGGNAIVRAGGDSQGTGVFEVTQDGGSHGGGMSYNGDGTPAWVSGESADHVTFYRIQSGTRTEVFHYPYNSNTVNFNATPTVGGNSIYHVGNKPSLADLGFTGDSNANYITNNNQLTNGAGYVTSSGNTVIGTDSDIDFTGATVLATASLTDGVWTSFTSRTLTLADLGYTGATNANYITNNNQLTNGAGYITNSGGTTAATANTVAKRDSSADISARLFRSNYQNQTTIAGGIAFRVSTTDNYIRFCTDGAAIRSFIGAGTSSFSGSYDDLTNKPTIPTNNNQLTNGAGYITEAITDLGITKTTTTNTITSSSGTNATITEATGSAAGLMSTAHHNKLDGIASGAEVNVQSDWNATSGDALILNKPTIPTNNNQLTNGAGYITEAITNLSYNASVRELSSSSGTGVTLPLATTSVAGLFSSSDKTKLDGLSAGASLPLTGGTMTGSIVLPSGFVDEPSIQYDSDTGIYFPGTDQFAISTAGSQRLYINSTGNVGIGQSSPGAKLDVNGDIEVNSLRIGRGPGNIDTNAVLGADAFNNNSTGYSNTALGSITLTYNTTGANNTAVGSGAMFTNTNGNNNTGVGYYALTSNSSGASNTAVGLQALYENTTGTGNVAVGFKSLNSSQTTNYNTAIGMYALRFNTSGTENTAGGYQALASNTTGYYNTAFGYDAGESVTTGHNNTAIGRRSLYNNATGHNNTAAGSGALNANYTGYDNVAVGSEALTTNNSGRENVAVGRQALKVATTAIRNTSVGHQAGISNTTGSYNTGTGYRALYTNTTGAYNTACGYEALESVSSTNESVGVGYRALYASTGSYNVAVGGRALFGATTGSGNIGIGHINSSGTYAPTFTVTTHSNRLVLGHTSITNAYVKVGWSITSDERDKMNFAPVPHGLDFVNQLNPVAFQFKVDRDTPTPDGQVRYGFKAQDILALEGNDPIIIDSEDPDHLKYKGEHLVPVLVNAIQELTGMVKDLQAQVNALQNS